MERVHLTGLLSHTSVTVAQQKNFHSKKEFKAISKGTRSILYQERLLIFISTLSQNQQFKS